MVFGHHFAAIAGAGPLVGPVLAAQFGFLPGTLWIIAGWCWAAPSRTWWCCSSRCGATASRSATDRGGGGPVAGLPSPGRAGLILVILLALLTLVVVNALKVAVGDLYPLLHRSDRPGDGNVGLPAAGQVMEASRSAPSLLAALI